MGRSIKDTNITAVELGKPISIKNLVVHVMSHMIFTICEKHEMTIYVPKEAVAKK